MFLHCCTSGLVLGTVGPCRRHVDYSFVTPITSLIPLYTQVFLLVGSNKKNCTYLLTSVPAIGEDHRVKIFGLKLTHLLD